MKLIAARIRNFKLLRNIDLCFSTVPNRPLTIIRAENGSGKTSTLQALRWALYGESVLEKLAAPSVRLSPSDWPDLRPCTISVEIDFIHTAVSSIANRIMTSETKFTLKREAEERPEGDIPNRQWEKLRLFEKTPRGAEEIGNPEDRLETMLPKAMLNIFFTDGDDAMTFISEPTRQDKVMGAIRLLLGLELMEDAAKRIGKERTRVNRQIRDNTQSMELADVLKEKEENEQEKERKTNSISELSRKIEDTQNSLQRNSQTLMRALAIGNYEELGQQLQKYKKNLSAAQVENEEYKRQHQALFQSESLGWGLVGSVMHKGFEVLQRLHDQGVLPRVAIPVLKERLELARCICGADLSMNTDAYQQVVRLIEGQREADEQIHHLTELYYQAKGEVMKWHASSASRWKEENSELCRRRFSIQERIDEAEQELKAINSKLETIEQQQIEQIRRQEKMLKSHLQWKEQELSNEKASLKNIGIRLEELERDLTKLRRTDQKIRSLNMHLTVIDDLDQLVTSTLTEMQSSYLCKVSQRMNSLFLDMAGSEPDQETIFQGTEIDPNYSIRVLTKDGRTLNPDYEVNGANQRALTFAFIWALTEVSGVVAPRVIDTPLGMMSGSVKRRVLQMVSQPVENEVDRQVILFLTQSEIAQTEDILDDRVGAAMTLIKTDDYPVDLVNDPEANQPEIRLCPCSHRQYCTQCQRVNARDYSLQQRVQ